MAVPGKTFVEIVGRLEARKLLETGEDIHRFESRAQVRPLVAGAARPEYVPSKLPRRRNRDRPETTCAKSE